MAKYVELRRHTDADGDMLTPEGVRAAVEIGSRLEGGYEVLVSTGAQRATQTLACFLAGLGQKVPHGVVVEPGLRSAAEDRWRAAYDLAYAQLLSYRVRQFQFKLRHALRGNGAFHDQHETLVRKINQIPYHGIAVSVRHLEELLYQAPW
jgi:broad specificity phosphatase PhoE